MSSGAGEWVLGGREWMEAEVCVSVGGDAGGGASRCQNPGSCRLHNGPRSGTLSFHQVRDGQERQGQSRGCCADYGFSPSGPSENPQTHSVPSTPSPSSSHSPQSSGSGGGCGARAPGRASSRQPASRSFWSSFRCGTRAEHRDQPQQPRYLSLFLRVRSHLPVPLSF